MAMNPRLLRPLASGITDPSLISGLGLWLDAADSTTLFDADTGGSLPAADGAVGRWEDKSGSGRNCTQGTPNNRPIRKVAQINGIDAIRFDGTDDRLIITSNFPGHAWTFLCVAQKWSIATDVLVLAGREGGSGIGFAPIVLREIAAAPTITTSGRADTVNTSSVSSAPVTFFSSARMFNTTAVFLAVAVSNLTHRANRANAPITATDSANQLGLFQCVGAAAAVNMFAKADFAEILGYTRVLSEAEIKLAENYLRRKWNTP